MSSETSSKIIFNGAKGAVGPRYLGHTGKDIVGKLGGIAEAVLYGDKITVFVIGVRKYAAFRIRGGEYLTIFIVSIQPCSFGLVDPCGPITEIVIDIIFVGAVRMNNSGQLLEFNSGPMLTYRRCRLEGVPFGIRQTGNFSAFILK